MLVCLLIGLNIFSTGEFLGKGITSEMKITVPQFLTSEPRSMSKLFGLFQVFVCSFPFLKYTGSIFCLWIEVICIIIQESVQSTSSLVLMENVLVKRDFAVTEITVMMVYMKSNVVSLLSLSPLSRYCIRLWADGELFKLCYSNQVEIETNIGSCLSDFSLFQWIE